MFSKTLLHIIPEHGERESSTSTVAEDSKKELETETKSVPESTIPSTRPSQTTTETTQKIKDSSSSKDPCMLSLKERASLFDKQDVPQTLKTPRPGNPVERRQVKPAMSTPKVEKPVETEERTPFHLLRQKWNQAAAEDKPLQMSEQTPQRSVVARAIPIDISEIVESPDPETSSYLSESASSIEVEEESLQQSTIESDSGQPDTVEEQEPIVEKDPSPVKRAREEYTEPVPEPLPKTPRIAELSRRSDRPPLVQTLSFYRKQRPFVKVAETLQEKKEDSDSEGEDEKECDTEEDTRARMEQEVEYFEKEAALQLGQMQQAAGAVLVSRSAPTQQNTSAFVEAERVLLVSTMKHQAARDEASNLKRTLSGQCTAPPVGVGRGLVSLKHLSLPLKADFLRQLHDDADEHYVHHFIIMVRFRGQVSFTQMLSTNSTDMGREGTLVFPNLINFHGLPSDFALEVQIFTLRTKGRMETGPEPATPRARSHSGGHLATPKTAGRSDHRQKSKLWTPIKKWTSGTPKVAEAEDADRAVKPGFFSVGKVTLTIRNIFECRLALRGVAQDSPLTGVLGITGQCSMVPGRSFQGYMNLFEDISGIGAWTRKWFSLEGPSLKMWKYQEDAAKREQPIEVVDLRRCITGEFRKVRSDRCARANSLLVAIARPALPGDEPGLCVERKAALTVRSYVLSCDTEEQHKKWCAKLTQHVTDMRQWDPDAAGPRPEGSPDYLPSFF